MKKEQNKSENKSVKEDKSKGTLDKGRRDFLKDSATAASGIATLAILGSAANAPAMESQIQDNLLSADGNSSFEMVYPGRSVSSEGLDTLSG